jgi:predicted nucleic acid-binding protein
VNSDRVCIDASLALCWLLNVQTDARADALWQRWRENEVRLVGPPLFPTEVTSVLREEVFFKRLSPEEGEEAFNLYSGIPVAIINHPSLSRKAWDLAREYHLPRTYDMQYLAVADLEDCEFWTLDKKLVNSLRGKNRRLKWVGDDDQR